MTNSAIRSDRSKKMLTIAKTQTAEKQFPVRLRGTRQSVRQIRDCIGTSPSCHLVKIKKEILINPCFDLLRKRILL